MAYVAPLVNNRDLREASLILVSSIVVNNWASGVALQSSIETQCISRSVTEMIDIPVRESTVSLWYAYDACILVSEDVWL